MYVCCMESSKVQLTWERRGKKVNAICEIYLNNTEVFVCVHACVTVQNWYFRIESSILRVLPCIHTKVVCHASFVTHLRSCHSSLL